MHTAFASEDPSQETGKAVCASDLCVLCIAISLAQSSAFLVMSMFDLVVFTDIVMSQISVAQCVRSKAGKIDELR